MDDPEKDVLLPCLKECLERMAKRKKLPYKAANYLLVSVLYALAQEDGNISDEIKIANITTSQLDDSTQDGLDDTIQGSTEGASSSGACKGTPDPKPDQKPDQGGQSSSKNKEICRFYARGHCNKKMA